MMTLTPQIFAQHAVGTILGGAIGDALGRQTESLSLRDIHIKYGLFGVTDFEATPDPIWIFTQQMTLPLADALLDTKAGRRGNIMDTMVKRFVEWFSPPDKDRALRESCSLGCQNLMVGMPWYASGKIFSKGCEAALRVAPIGIVFKEDPQNLDEVAAASTLLTHRHPTAQAAAIVAARLVAFALNHPDPAYFKTHAIDAVLQNLSPNAREMVAKLRQVASVVNRPPDHAYKELGEGLLAEEAVAGALYAVLSTNDFRNAVLRAVNTQGDSASLAAIAGNIAGALYGFDAIPESWREKVEAAQELINTGKNLAALARTIQPGKTLIHNPQWHQFPEIRRALYDPQTSLDLFNKMVQDDLDILGSEHAENVWVAPKTGEITSLKSYIGIHQVHQRLLNDSRLSLPVRLALGIIQSKLTDPQLKENEYITELSLLSASAPLTDEAIQEFEKRITAKYPKWRERIRTQEWAEEVIRKFNPAWIEELKKLRGLTEEFVPQVWQEDYSRFIHRFRESILAYLDKFGWVPHLVEWYFVAHANFLRVHNS